MNFILRHPRVLRAVLSVVPWYLSIVLFWIDKRVPIIVALPASDFLISAEILVILPAAISWFGWRHLSQTAWSRRRALWSLINALLVGFFGMYAWSAEPFVLRLFGWFLIASAIKAGDDMYWYFSSND